MESDVARFRHDLRNKLNALRLSVYALEISENEREALEWLDTIDRAADRLLDLLPEDEYLPGMPMEELYVDIVPLNTWNP
jgi:signal transduction histidine kinase